MEINATIEQMSAPLTYKYKNESGVEREFSYVEVVLNDGLNRIFGETTGSVNAQELCKQVKIGDNVVALVRFEAILCKKQDGGSFFKNRVKILDMKKEFQLGETLPETF
jgi:hypothetical protein